MLNEFEKNELEKVQQEVRYMEQVPEHLKANKEFMLEAIKISWCTMYFAAPELKDNEEFVLTAIAIDPDVYMHISDRLKDNEKITSLAIKESHVLYFHASDRLKYDGKFKNNTLKTNSWYPWIKLNKVLKNNFWEGLGDTFSIMHGDYALLKKWNGNEVDPNQLKYGLVDITFIPQLSNTLLNYGMPCTPSVDNPFKYVGLRHNTSILEDISKYLGLGLQFLRFTMAATATIMVLPLLLWSIY
ncbi:DUF4116 domain-containing protein [uncultured Legionella sp.]|uniref:DUF4116 domain-containing protein n=1 Tax=uncultured Legionella sp. TaxID=210934 RepID=UPI00260A27AD|nr:DUF4116 domain-containing protein [uncultured Legionella sp.]